MIFLDQLHSVTTPQTGPQPLLLDPYPGSATSTGGERLETLINGMTRSIHLQGSDMSSRFFSAANVDEIQRRVRDIVRQETGYTVDRQSDDAVLTVMRYVYVQYSRNGATDVDREVGRLNDVALAEIVPSVATGLVQYLAYLRDASRLPQPLPRPQQTSIKGSKTTELFRPL